MQRTLQRRTVIQVAVLLAAAACTAADATAAPPDLAFAPMAPGNVLAPGEPPTLTVTTRADRVAWTVTDFWHVPIASGTVAVADAVATVRPPAATNGYYLLHLRAESGGRVLPRGERFVSFAVVPAHAPRDRATSPFGVMTHFAQGMDPAILPLLARIGIATVRDEHYWAQVERQPGVYAFPEKSDRYMAACRAAGIDPLIALTFGNPLHDHPDGPTTPAGFEAYGAYGQAVLRRYGDQVRWLEVWNEYNGSWAPPPARVSLEARYTTYTAMLKAAHARIKAVRPDVQVLGGACVLVPLPYLEGIFRLGGLEAMDGVVIHPYRAQPEGVERELDELNALIRRYNGGRDKPVWVTETGRHARDEYDWEAGRGLFERGRRDNARYLARMYTLLLSRRVAKACWYLAADHATFVSMGLLRGPDDALGRYAVAPPYVAYATLIRQLDGATFERREAASDYTRAHVYRFRRDGAEVRVCWATQPAKLRVRTTVPLTLTTLVGGETTLRPRNGELVLDLSGDAFYLAGHADSVEEVDTGVRILADAADDYAKTQGQANWFYGYTLGGGPFTEMTPRETMWGEEWAGPAKYLNLSRGSMHPERIGGRDACPVLRWRSPVAGDVRLVGTVSRGARQGDGVTARLHVDGAVLFERHLGGADAPSAAFDLPVSVRAGACVDLSVAPGADTGYDATGFTLRVEQAAAAPPAAGATGR